MNNFTKLQNNFPYLNWARKQERFEGKNNKYIISFYDKNWVEITDLSNNKVMYPYPFTDITNAILKVKDYLNL
jgi:hypothetical protein